MNIPMSDGDKLAIYRELLHIPTRYDYPQPNIIVQEVMAMNGIPQTEAYNLLESKVASGEFKKATVKIGGHNTNVYWLASLEKPDTPQASDE